MFWRMTGLSAASPVDTVLDKENYTLEELLNEDEIIQVCKALNTRLINFLRDRAQVEQLIRYILEETPEDAERKRTFKFPFVACEIITCEVDIILRTLVEDKELMDLLFSILKPDCPHSTFLAGYFSKDNHSESIESIRSLAEKCFLEDYLVDSPIRRPLREQEITVPSLKSIELRKSLTDVVREFRSENKFKGEVGGKQQVDDQPTLTPRIPFLPIN